MSQARFMFNTLLLSSLIILLRFPFVTQAHRSKSFKPYGFVEFALSPDIIFCTIGVCLVVWLVLVVFVFLFCFLGLGTEHGSGFGIRVCLDHSDLL